MLLIKKADIFSTLVLMAAGLASCKFIPLSAETPPLEQLAYSGNEISNWQPESGMSIYIGSELFSLIDGGAPQYLNNGLIKTGYQRVNGPGGTIVETYVMDFGNETNAQNMFNDTRTQFAGNLIPDPKYSITMVCARNMLGGVSGYARCANFYFEVNVLGYKYVSDAMRTLNQFLGLYFEKLRSGQ